MIASLAVTAGLLLQAAGNGHQARANRAPDPVRIWRADSTVYVALRQPGDLLVLHVDAIGRIQVLFPAGPDDDSAMLANDTLIAIPLPPAAEGNPATFVAVRSRWAFEFAALRTGSAWNYNGALLLQPTAGDPLVDPMPACQRIVRSDTLEAPIAVSGETPRWRGSPWNIGQSAASVTLPKRQAKPHPQRNETAAF